MKVTTKNITFKNDKITEWNTLDYINKYAIILQIIGVVISIIYNYRHFSYWSNFTFHYPLILTIFLIWMLIIIFIFAFAFVHESIHIMSYKNKIWERCTIHIKLLTIGIFYDGYFSKKRRLLSSIAPFFIISLLSLILFVFNIDKILAGFLFIFNLIGSSYDIVLFFYILIKMKSDVIFYNNKWQSKDKITDIIILESVDK